mmetsp:Transcript_343/g.317  ORF Transcript_343/g.317 Transcript_343/m.317 type:complete len:135 (+) Transcript_343:397-801(+)
MDYAPYGDLCQLINKTPVLQNDEVLLRTMFHQIIDGIEYLHDNDMAHLDIKGENVLIGKGFHCQLCDFDFCFSEEGEKISGRGTPVFRCPELMDESKHIDPKKADIFSAGILLFTMKFKIFPYLENGPVGRFNL